MKVIKKKVGKVLLSSTMILTMAFSVIPTNVFAEENDYSNENTSSSRAGDVEINASYFPDANFRDWVKRHTDTNADGKLSIDEIAKVTSIDVIAKNISSLTGIEHFTALTELNCQVNELTSLDLRQNTSLIKLNCYYNKLESLDLSKNTDLTDLICSDNGLTSLDLSKNEALTALSCSENQLTSLNLTNNTKLTNLDCHSNTIKDLELSKSTDLTDLDCYENQLTSLDLTNNTKLKELGCSSNNITDLNLSKNTDLTDLNYANNQLTSLDLTNNTKLKELGCSSNNITSLDLSKNTDLIKVTCVDNLLDGLDVTKNPNLKELICVANKLTSLDVTNNPALENLDCSENLLTSLDVTKNTDLDSLNISINPLGSVDLSKNVKLTSLTCYNSKLSSLDVSANVNLDSLMVMNFPSDRIPPALEYIKKYSNEISSLDVSKNIALTNLNCSGNQLTSLDLSENVNLEDVDCSNQKPSILFEKSKGYKLSAYDTKFDKNKASGITFTDDGSIVDAALDTPLSYNYDIEFAEPLSLRSDKMTMDVTLTFVAATDSSRLEEAKPLAEKAITDISATNDTTAGNILDKVKTGISSVDDVTASWEDGSPIITKATKDKEGSITGTIILTSGSKTVEVAVNKVINKLSVIDDEKLAKAKPLVETAIKDMKVSNTTTDKDFLDTVKNSITSITGVTISWKAGSPIITKATNDKDGSITGTIVLTNGSKTIEITVNKVINKLSSKTTIVDKTTGIEIAYEDGSAFEDDITLVVTPKSKEEMKGFQNNVNKVVAGKTIAGVYDIKLLKNGAEIQPNGKLKIRLTLTDEMKTMSELQVVYIDDNGKVTIIPSQLVDGKLVFITDHFSYYGVIGKENSTGQIQPETPSKPNSPQTGDTSNTMLSLGLIVLSGSIVGYGVKKKKALRK
ncbi:leucine-rich repeat domain-containing protein [Amedibacillus sp. YH-ame10]